MGHNISNAERRRNLLVTRLGSLAGQGWVFSVTCPRCRETRERRLDNMIERHGPVRMGDVVKRFRCSTP